MRRRWWAAGCCGVVPGLVGLLVACSSQATTPHPRVPTFATSAAPSSAPADLPPKSCVEVAQASDVDGIVGHQLAGSMNQIVGVPMPTINRTGRIDCYYGIPAGKPITQAVLVIGIASYTDPQSAAHRASTTVNNARDAGATTSDVRVGTYDAVVLAGAKTQELVMSAGNFTVLVTADNGVLTNGKVGQQLVQLAQRALSAGA